MKMWWEMESAGRIDAGAGTPARFARRPENAGEWRVAPASERARPSQPVDLRFEIERFMASGRPELAAERLLSAILTAGLEATVADLHPPSSRAPIDLRATAKLTRRERQVATLVAMGNTNRAIADQLYIARSTVERHVANILNKLAFNSRSQIAAWAVANGLATAA